VTSSHPDKGNSRGAVASSADKATTQPKKGAPGKREHLSPSPVDDATNGVMEDAERKGAEERIRFQATLLDAVGQAAIATDLEGKVTYWNRAAEKLYGWSEEEVIGQTLAEFVISEDLRERATEIRAGLREGKSWAGEFIVQRKDGSTFPAMVTNTPVHDERGNLVGMIGVSADITERKRAEEALRESEERFRTTFENAPLGVALVGLDGRRFRVNRSLCEMLGCSEEDLLGENYLEHVHPDDRQISTEHFQRALEEGAGSYELERRYLRADGHVVWNLTSVSLVQDSKGNPSYFVCLHQDITERKLVEEALRSSEEFFRALYENVHHPIFLLDEDLNFVDVNPHACRFFGFSREEFKRMKLSDITLTEELENQLVSTETMRQEGEILVLGRVVI
jgi:PAS domain S-box-containing protein